MKAPSPRASKSRFDAPLGKVLDFMRLLWSLDHALQSTSKRMESSLGITGPQRLTIRIIGRYPGISAGDLARILHLHPSTLTGVLRRLERRTLIKRTTDATDGRRSLFRLTAGGIAVDRTRTGTVEAAVRRAVAKLSPGQLASARFALSTLVAEIEPEP